MKPTYKATIFALAALALSQTAFAQAGASSGGLSGKEVLDLDGAIARRSLEEQAGRGQPQPTNAPAPVPATLTPEPIQTRVVRTYAPPRTVEVVGMDASAEGGPVTMSATLRWAGHSYPVSVGTVLKGYRVTRIGSNGTDLVALRGGKHLHVPRPTLDDLERADVTETTVPVHRKVADAGATAVVRPGAGSVVVQGSGAEMPLPASAARALPSGNTIAMPAPVQAPQTAALTVPTGPTSPAPVPPGLVSAERK